MDSDLTDEELFAAFFRRVAERVRDELHITIYGASDPLTIIWAAGQAFTFNPKEAHRQGLDVWVDRVVDQIRQWYAEETWQVRLPLEGPPSRRFKCPKTDI